MPKHLIHLICGGTGAGKTTYAMKLAADIGGARFSIDEWMTNLYWMDSPQPLVAEWSLERVRRCHVQIWETARRIADRGVREGILLGLMGVPAPIHPAAHPATHPATTTSRQ